MKDLSLCAGCFPHSEVLRDVDPKCNTLNSLGAGFQSHSCANLQSRQRIKALIEAVLNNGSEITMWEGGSNQSDQSKRGH